MKISFNWLKEYIALDISPEKTAELLTDCGLEVESVEKHETIKGGLEGCIVGEVKTKEKHPDADRLSVTTVDIGTGTLLNIVCGASNVAAGQKVVVATVGSTIYPVKGEPITLKKAKIRGAVSEGMICAEDELGLGTSHDGIMVLDAKTKVGTPAKEYFKIESDSVLEIGLTPNRSDASSHIGVAKDLFAVLNWKLAENKYELNVPSIDDFAVENTNKKIEVVVEDKDACPRYSGVTISGVAVKESPDWLKKRLLSIGLKPINNIVDVTNFVLHELGQPLHAFDADKIAGGKVIVKKASAGTKFTTLDGVERTLTADDLMICSATEPMCIAGVFGGLKSGVSQETKNIFLESACFSPTGIRKSSKHHGLKTDASFRFERGTDPNITVYALQRAALLIKEVAGGNLPAGQAGISSEIIDVYPASIEKKKVSFSFHHCERIIGKAIDPAQIKRILQLLHIDVVNEGGETLLLSVPTNKVDVTSEEDIAEEILRIYGCNNIEIPSAVRSSLSYVSKPDREKLRNTISDLLCGFGFNEIMSNSLTNSNYLELLPSEKTNMVELLNPLSPELNILRPTLLFSGLEAIAYNQNRKNADLKLFEFGKSYHTNSGKEKFAETNHLALFLSGKKQQEGWDSQKGSVDFFHLKAFTDNILKRLGIEADQISEMSSDILSSGLSYESRKKRIVELGWIKKTFLKKFDIKQEVFYADFNWDFITDLSRSSSIRFKEIPKFPEVRRDLALVVDKNVKYELLESLAYQTEKSLLKNVNLFDVYEGDKIESGKKSYALSFLLQDENATLTDKQVENVMEKLVKTYQEKAKAVIRS